MDFLKNGPGALGAFRDEQRKVLYTDGNDTTPGNPATPR